MSVCLSVCLFPVAVVEILTKQPKEGWVYFGFWLRSVVHPDGEPKQRDSEVESQCTWGLEAESSEWAQPALSCLELRFYLWCVVSMALV